MLNDYQNHTIQNIAILVLLNSEHVLLELMLIYILVFNFEKNYF